MTRPVRIEYAGAFYHLTTRGNQFAAIFSDDADRGVFLEILSQTCRRYRWQCYAYCLMNNHYHLLVETLSPNLSLGMRQLNGVYTQRFNRRHNTAGHVFQGRFQAVVAEKEAWFLELCRHVVLNPVRSGTVTWPEEWPWSSYGATAGTADCPDFLAAEKILAALAPDELRARWAYRKFVIKGLDKDSPWKSLAGRHVLGSPEFVSSLKPHLEEGAPRSLRFAGRPALKEIFGETGSRAERNRRIQTAHMQHGYTLKELGDYLGLHYSTVSKALKKIGAV